MEMFCIVMVLEIWILVLFVLILYGNSDYISIISISSIGNSISSINVSSIGENVRSSSSIRID